MKNKVTVNQNVKDIKSFYLTPKSVSGSKSVVNSLRNEIGIMENGVVTFKTGSISSISEMVYNNNLLSLSVGVTNVSLMKSNLFETTMVGVWTIHSITKELKRKNPTLTGITKKYVRSLLLNGELVVKFNVVKKDHGTTWFINKKKQPELIETTKVLKEKFVMIPRELYSQLFQLGQFIQPLKPQMV